MSKMSKCPRCGLPETNDPEIARRRAICVCYKKAAEGMIKMGFRVYPILPKPQENK